MLPTTAPSARPTIRCRRIVGGLAAGALLLGACSGSEGADEPEDTSTTEATTTNEDATTTTNVPEGPTSEDLEAILPTAAELGDGFTEVETPEQPSYFRLAMIDRCPDAVAVLDTPDGAVERTIVASDGVALAFELAPDQEPMDPAEEEGLVDALNDCSFAVRNDDGVLHSIEWAAGSDGIGDQAIRGAFTDSISSDAMPEPVGINTYFARVVVGDVSILVRGVDGYVDGQRVEFSSDEMAPITQEMVARVEGLTGS